MLTILYVVYTDSYLLPTLDCFYLSLKTKMHWMYTLNTEY